MSMDTNSSASVRANVSVESVIIPDDMVNGLEAVSKDKNKGMSIASGMEWKVLDRSDPNSARITGVLNNINSELLKVCESIEAAPSDLADKLGRLSKAAATIHHRNAPRLWATRIFGTLDVFNLFKGKTRADEAKAELKAAERTMAMTKAMQAIIELNTNSSDLSKKRAAKRAVARLDHFQNDKSFGGISEAAKRLQTAYDDINK